MSYYYKPNINYTSHSLQRARQRLKLQGKEDWEVKEILKKHIENSTKSFDKGNMAYISASNLNIYIVIDATNNTVITVTNVSPAKMLSLFGDE